MMVIVDCTVSQCAGVMDRALTGSTVDEYEGKKEMAEDPECMKSCYETL